MPPGGIFHPRIEAARRTTNPPTALLKMEFCCTRVVQARANCGAPSCKQRHICGNFTKGRGKRVHTSSYEGGDPSRDATPVRSSGRGRRRRFGKAAHRCDRRSKRLWLLYRNGHTFSARHQSAAENQPSRSNLRRAGSGFLFSDVGNGSSIRNDRACASADARNLAGPDQNGDLIAGRASAVHTHGNFVKSISHSKFSLDSVSRG